MLQNADYSVCASAELQLQSLFGRCFMPDKLKKRAPRGRKRASKQQQETGVASGREPEDSKKKPGRAGKTQGPVVIPDREEAR